MKTLPKIPEPNCTKTTLANGLDIIARRQGSLPIVAVNLWYHVGSKDEVRGQRGFAHLFEHLMFEGSEHYPGDFFQPLRRIGAGINGSTSPDRTNYYIDLPTAHVELALAMESDRMGFLLTALTDEKLRVQKGVVQNEYAQNYANRPYGRVPAVLAEAIYPPSHPYSWLTIGAMEDVQAATHSDVESFFRRYYLPSNASLSLVGDVDEDAAIALAERYFGPIPGGIRPPGPRVEAPRVNGTVELRMHDRVELDRAYDVWPTVPQFDPDDAPLALLADVLGRGRVSRLYRRLVEAGIAQNVSAQQAGRELAGTFGVTVTLRPGRASIEARQVVLAEIEAIAQRGPDPEELDRAKNRRVAGFVYALDNVGGFGGVADRLNAYNVFLGDPARFVTDLERFREVTALDVRRVAATFLDVPDRVTLDVLGRRAGPTVAPIDRATPPSPATAAGYQAPIPTIVPLDCGAQLWVITDRGLPITSVGAVLGAGADTHGPDVAGLANLTALLLDEGTHRHDAHSLAAAIEAKGSHLSTNCGYQGSTVFLQALTPYLAEGLDLVAEVVLGPTFPEAELVRLRGQMVASLRAERDSAEARAQRAMLRALYPAGHPYRVPVEGDAASVEHFQRGDLIAFHDATYHPGRAAWIAAGDVDADAVAAQLNGLLSGWQGQGQDRPKVPAATVPAPSRLILLDRPGAPQAVLRACQVGLTRHDPDYLSLVLFNQVLGGQFSSRLNQRLREQEGMTYGVRSHLDARWHPGPFWIGASVQSDRLAEAVELIRKELIALLDDRPPTEDELADSRRSLIEGQARHFEGPSALVSRFGGLFLHGLPPDEHRRLPERLASLSLDNVIQAARRLIHPDALVFVLVADAETVQHQFTGLSWAECERIDDLDEASQSGW
jgi:predicted Zn-dependent peptidase